MRLRSVVAVTGGLLLVAGVADAQATTASAAGVSVRGLAFDSLRALPLEGAFIRMTGGTSPARTTTSDTRGQFQFDSVVPGAYVFSMLHAALDSIGFSGVSVRATIGPGVVASTSVQLSVPSFATLWHAACGAGHAPSDSGFVFGTVRDAERQTPLAGATVVVRWITLGVDSTKARRVAPNVLEQAWGGEVRSDSTGGYTLCGVPSDATLRLLARKDSSASGLLELLPRDDKRPRVERRDLSIGPVADSAATRRGVVAGVVHDATGQAVNGARAMTAGADEVRSGADGRFVMPNVPIGTREIEVLTLGAQPVVVAADVTTKDTAYVAVELRKIVELPAVVVTEKTVRQRMLAEFEERKALGLGHFLDSARVAPFHDLQNALSLVVDADAVCPLFVDGVEYTTSRDIARELYTRSPLDVALIETHRLNDPSLPERYRVMLKTVADPRMSRGSGCGSPFKLKQVVLIWTKNWLP